MSEKSANAIDVHTMEFFHEGTDEIDFNRIAPIDDKPSYKPIGGFWFTEHREGELSSWQDWRSSEGFREYPMSADDIHGSVFSLKEDANILVINSKEDVDSLIHNFGTTDMFRDTVIDWQAVSEQYDGVYITEDVSWESHIDISGPVGIFNTWDVESGVLFSSDPIKDPHPISEDEKEQMHDLFEERQDHFPFPGSFSQALDTKDEQRIYIDVQYNGHAENYDNEWKEYNDGNHQFDIEIYAKDPDNGLIYKVFNNTFDIDNPYTMEDKIVSSLTEYSGNFSDLDNNSMQEKELFLGSADQESLLKTDFLQGNGDEVNEQKEIQEYHDAGMTSVKHILYPFESKEEGPTKEQLKIDPKTTDEIHGTSFLLSDNSKVFTVDSHKDLDIFLHLYLDSPGSIGYYEELKTSSYDKIYTAVYITKNGQDECKSDGYSNDIKHLNESLISDTGRGVLCRTEDISEQHPLSTEEKEKLIEEIYQENHVVKYEDVDRFIQNDDISGLMDYLDAKDPDSSFRKEDEDDRWNTLDALKEDGGTDAVMDFLINTAGYKTDIDEDDTDKAANDDNENDKDDASNDGSNDAADDDGHDPVE